MTIKYKNGDKWENVIALKGDDYILTDEDKQEIADIVTEENPPYDDTEIREELNNKLNKSELPPPYDDTNIKKDISDLQKEDESINKKIQDIELTKFPNVTIIGQPTINQGQISNFSTANYLQFPFVVNFQNQKFEIDFEFTTGSDVSNQHNILDSNFGLAFAVRQNRFVVAISTNGTNWDMGEGVGTHPVTPNTTYRIKMLWNGVDSFNLSYSTDGGQSYISDITKALTAQPYPKQMFIGISYDRTHNFNGIVNLNYAKLIVADKLVWQGMDDVGIATRMAVDMSNIDESGINRLYDLVKGGGYVKDTDLENVLSGKSEEWTFTLEDGSIITRNVVVVSD